ncbi:hypothetical protein QWM81_20575 [Streptomyces ficellus]|uniref:AIM24 family protein n=1 Tax=Streptomyces ficellus TaxID=1977088 RepID=A0ABT7ZAE4_9ACTN|nr:hypothetical protein [Streptomyces ficellus]MDN3296410.1 hypothetical protein [Streptomyces ficellus]
MSIDRGAGPFTGGLAARESNGARVGTGDLGSVWASGSMVDVVCGAGNFMYGSMRKSAQGDQVVSYRLPS